MKSVLHWRGVSAYGGLTAMLVMGIYASAGWAAEEPSDQDAPVVVVEPVEVKGENESKTSRM